MRGHAHEERPRRHAAHHGGHAEDLLGRLRQDGHPLANALRHGPRDDVIPAVGNEFIAMIKDSALVSFVTIQELFWRASTVGSRNFRSFETLLVAEVTGATKRYKGFAEQCMAEYDLDGWTAKDLVDAADVRAIGKR